jgi:hypothetical protein
MVRLTRLTPFPEFSGLPSEPARGRRPFPEQLSQYDDLSDVVAGVGGDAMKHSQTARFANLSEEIFLTRSTLQLVEAHAKIPNRTFPFLGACRA